ncbi:MAG TPA: hypothetical protein VGR28_01545, partial [Candidatus Thermoplasmatota archaeon]|nr:hypothetical protein [Candidatus Thermoplasmatota archaeon]
MRARVLLVLATLLAGCLDGMPALLTGPVPDDVRFAPAGDQVEASLLRGGETTAGPEVRLALLSFRGDVVVEEADGPLRATMRLAAVADTQEQARARVLALEAVFRIEGDAIVARASTDDPRGASAEIRVLVPPGTPLTGSVEAEDGAVRVAGSVHDMTLASARGPVAAALRGAGALQLRAAMGAVEAALAPTGPARLDVEARDGDVLLQLSEGPGVGYDLEAAATGDVSASMREAALEG